ncbi:MAG: DNA mismatch repair endonuclease MutL [Bacteroidota bacterium]
MADVIQLLPDSIANQIAAGEVIQRPASVVKELLENAVDAGSTSVQLIVKDAGKTLIQVVDDGCGMSETDARLSFERHATSKIRHVNDLFAIRTMGFRGEALASIASIAQVELKTRQRKNDLGTRICIEGSILKKQEACQCAAGTSLAVKNLFYNVPARRKFLKSNTVEMRHINDEFTRVAMAHPDVFFSLRHNGTEVYHLPKSNLRQRVVNLLGGSSNKKLVPLNEETDLVRMYGFVGKPEFAKKTRGEQFFFVNGRFIKSGWLNHAILGAYEDLLPKDTHPLYIVFIEMNPQSIDINVHPTKQEIKFDDDKMIYNYLKVTTRHALGQHSVTPTLDFEQDPIFWENIKRASQQQVSSTSDSIRSSGSASSSTPSDEFQARNEQAEMARQRNNLANWQSLYESEGDSDIEVPFEEGEIPTAMTIPSKISDTTNTLDDSSKSFSREEKKPHQIHKRYIVNQIKSGFWLIDQQAAHERILYERYLQLIAEGQNASQKKLFPQTIQLSLGDATLLQEVLPEIARLGFDIEHFGGSSFVVHGVPAEFHESASEQAVIEQLLDQLKRNQELKLDFHERIARSMAVSAAIKRGQSLSTTEMELLIDQLFACEIPMKSPTGRKCFLSFDLEELNKRFKD